MTKQQKTFVAGAMLLAAAGLIVKIIGALYRIPLANIIGTEGMGYYQFAYPVYSLLVVVSTAGLPAAISKLVSERTESKDLIGAYYVFLTSRRLLFFLGIISTAIMFLIARPIALLQGNENAIYALMAIAPALFFVASISSYRGYFQGLQNMVPTALTQIVEQCGKLIIGLALAYLFLLKTGRPELGAAGALVGVTLSECIALFCIMGIYRKRKKTIMLGIGQVDPAHYKAQSKGLLKKILLIAIPVTISACVMPIVGAIDSVVVSRSLIDAGYTIREATASYGVLSGMVIPLINMPSVLALALYTSLIPAIAQSAASGNSVEVQEKSSLGLKLAVVVGLPAAVGFFVLSSPILSMLYRNITPAEMDMATGLMQILSMSVLFLTIGQTMMGILQGLGKAMLPVISLAVGATVKVVLSVMLIRVPEININGAAIGTLVCYIIVAVMNIIFVVKRARFAGEFKNRILKPVIATAVMAAVVMLLYRLLGGHSNTLAVIVAILAGIVVYLVLLIFTRALTPRELQFVPGGRKLVKIMKKWKVES